MKLDIAHRHSERSRRNPVAKPKVIPRDPSTSLRSAQDDPGSLIINSIQFPSSLRFVTPNHFGVLQLQIPLDAAPRFFVPPVSGKQIRTALIDYFPEHFRTV